MQKLAHKKLLFGLGTLALGLLVLWLFYPRNTEPPSPLTSHEVTEQTPAESGERPASVSDDDSNTPDEIALPDIDVRAMVKDARRKERAERERQLAMTVSNESTPEKVRNLLYETAIVGDMMMEADSEVGIRYIPTLHNDPRVTALVEVGINGTPSEKQELLEALVEMCEVFLEELPLLPSDPEAFPPERSVHNAGGSKAFPYLLTYVDKDATTLGLLTKMYLRMQKAQKEHHKGDSDAWYKSKKGLVFAYACDHFLNIYETRVDLQEKLSPRQLELLKEYDDHRKTWSEDRNRRMADYQEKLSPQLFEHFKRLSGEEDWNIERRQKDVMKVAVAFVQGESERNDSEMR